MTARRAREEPLPLRDAIASVNRQLGLPDPEALSAFVEAWPEIVGPALAQHAMVRSLRDGICSVEVDEPGWATQLRYLESAVVERAAVVCGTGVVRAMRVFVARR